MADTRIKSLSSGIYPSILSKPSIMGYCKGCTLLHANSAECCCRPSTSQFRPHQVTYEVEGRPYDLKELAP
eukprot:scaffold4604_cov110-Skeletonema_dohrnii-CCMP3373.AAC.10